MKNMILNRLIRHLPGSKFFTYFYSMEIKSEIELFLVRHGETQWNVENRFQGQLDSPLTETGIRQAEQLGKALAGIPFDDIISSDLGRAIHTANLTNPYVSIQSKRIPYCGSGILVFFMGSPDRMWKNVFLNTANEYGEKAPMKEYRKEKAVHRFTVVL
jgi:bisphosphoglycerate-dependent phosphoglycerate mutase